MGRDDQRQAVKNIPLEQLKPFKNHPFQVRDDEEFRRLVESIEIHGVIHPAVARQIGEDCYELISGHRRKAACEVLGYKDTVNALKTHCREDGVAFYHLTDNLGRKQKAKFISEGNLYRLIVHSKLPSAERFEKWVFDEVLPTIRKHGSYLTKEKLWEVATSPEALLKLCSDLLAEREENVSLRIANAQLEGKAAFYDLFIDLEHSTNLRTTAKELAVPERRFVRFLLEKRFV